MIHQILSVIFLAMATLGVHSSISGWVLHNEITWANVLFTIIGVTGFVASMWIF